MERGKGGKKAFARRVRSYDGEFACRVVASRKGSKVTRHESRRRTNKKTSVMESLDGSKGMCNEAASVGGERCRQARSSSVLLSLSSPLSFVHLSIFRHCATVRRLRHPWINQERAGLTPHAAAVVDAWMRDDACTLCHSPLFPPLPFPLFLFVPVSFALFACDYNRAAVICTTQRRRLSRGFNRRIGHNTRGRRRQTREVIQGRKEKRPTTKTHAQHTFSSYPGSNSYQRADQSMRKLVYMPMTFDIASQLLVGFSCPAPFAC
jgi:hypothetical protein